MLRSEKTKVEEKRSQPKEIPHPSSDLNHICTHLHLRPLSSSFGDSEHMNDALSAVTLELDKVAPFLIKLFEIVSSSACDDLVCWSEHGETFRIVDRTKFAQVCRAPHRCPHVASPRSVANAQHPLPTDM